MNFVLIRLPHENGSEFRQLWKDIRLQEGLNSDADLPDAIESDNFDGSSFVEWAVPLLDSITPIVTCLVGYLVAKRGEIEIERNGSKVKMKNMKASQLEKVIQALDGDD